MSLKVGENIVWVSKLWYAWDAELLGVSPGSKLFAYGIIVVSSGLWVKSVENVWQVFYDKWNCLVFNVIICVCPEVTTWLNFTLFCSPYIIQCPPNILEKIKNIYFLFLNSVDPKCESKSEPAYVRPGPRFTNNLKLRLKLHSNT